MSCLKRRSGRTQTHFLVHWTRYRTGLNLPPLAISPVLRSNQMVDLAPLELAPPWPCAERRYDRRLISLLNDRRIFAPYHGLIAEKERDIPYQVLIADDHPLTREGLAMAARLGVPHAVVHFAGTIGEAEDRITPKNRYHLILLDLMMPDASGFSGLLRLQFADKNSRIAVITARKDLSLAAIARELGAVAFLHKSEPIDTLARQIQKIAAGGSIFPADMASAKVGMRDRIAKLSDAQRRVLFALADGRSNKQIAFDLGLTEATVKAHLTAIYRRLGVHNRAQAMVALQPMLGRIVDDA